MKLEIGKKLEKAIEETKRKIGEKKLARYGATAVRQIMLEVCLPSDPTLEMMKRGGQEGLYALGVWLAEVGKVAPTIGALIAAGMNDDEIGKAITDGILDFVDDVAMDLATEAAPKTDYKLSG